MLSIWLILHIILFLVELLMGLLEGLEKAGEGVPGPGSQEEA